MVNRVLWLKVQHVLYFMVCKRGKKNGLIEHERKKASYKKCDARSEPLIVLVALGQFNTSFPRELVYRSEETLFEICYFLCQNSIILW
ncbi:hypothetical protein VIGAN_01049800 [Vigna angularis var. angularis]|uniref:Uncharacterized protein n=1 Tax=Vigna angularis var. angularis TaxID=157739 RepID=A0A0S3QXH9_PHAAN|nr:hypothetical protein VIGAN_01049800 [Vigna angularis var. angularis]